MRRYTIMLIADPDVGGYTVIVPALPECVTEGDTVEEAMCRARELIRGYLDSRAASGEPIPEEPVAIQFATVEV